MPIESGDWFVDSNVVSTRQGVRTMNCVFIFANVGVDWSVTDFRSMLFLPGVCTMKPVVLESDENRIRSSSASDKILGNFGFPFRISIPVPIPQL